jgi:hypothetical protein
MGMFLLAVVGLIAGIAIAVRMLSVKIECDGSFGDEVKHLTLRFVPIVAMYAAFACALYIVSVSWQFIASNVHI